MDLRLAHTSDLPQLKAMYGKIIAGMEEKNIQIWDEIYPCAFFADDIACSRLYVLTHGCDIAAAFALCASSAGAGCMQWSCPDARALYVERFGVNVNCWRKGVGTLALAKAVACAGALGAAYLRLLAADINVPAIRLYAKNGFKQVPGAYDQVIDGGPVLHELGFEKRTPAPPKKTGGKTYETFTGRG